MDHEHSKGQETKPPNKLQTSYKVMSAKLKDSLLQFPLI